MDASLCYKSQLLDQESHKRPLCRLLIKSPTYDHFTIILKLTSRLSMNTNAPQPARRPPKKRRNYSRHGYLMHTFPWNSPKFGISWTKSSITETSIVIRNWLHNNPQNLIHNSSPFTCGARNIHWKKKRCNQQPLPKAQNENPQESNKIYKNNINEGSRNESYTWLA